jgi:hypothetical protein
MGDGDAALRRFDYPSHQRPHAARGYWGHNLLPETRAGASGRYSGKCTLMM